MKLAIHNITKMAALAAAFALVVAGTAASEPVRAADGPITVGDFSVKLAKALNLPEPQGGFKAESAGLALWKKGVRLPADQKKTLTEEDVVSAMAGLGLSLRTDSPTRAVSQERATSIVQTFVTPGANDQTGSSLSQNPNDDFNNGNGKGGKFKRKKDKSPSDTGDDG